MTESTGKIVTYADLHTIPENMVGEIINGELVATPRPSVKHSYSASTLGSEIKRCFYKIERGSCKITLYLIPNAAVAWISGAHPQKLPEQMIDF